MTTHTMNNSLRTSEIAPNHSLLKFAVVFATISTIIINVLSNAVPFNNQSTADISDSYKILFVPAGYVFAIWGVIYIGMIAYAVFQARQRDDDAFWSNVAGWYLVGCVANSVWIFLWHWNQLGWSVLLTLLLLVSLLAIYLQMSKRGWEWGNRSTAETWAVYVPLSLYLGWASVAFIANISAWLWQLNWSGFGLSDTSWAVIMLVIAAMVGIFFGGWRRNLAYAGVIVWAFVGIGVKQAEVLTVAYSAYALAALVMIVAIWGQLKENKRTIGT